MENLLDAVDHLRNRLGLFYWTIRHNGDRERAAEQLREAITCAARTDQPADAVASSLFLQWQYQQLRLLLGTARQTLKRLGLESRKDSHAYHLSSVG